MCNDYDAMRLAEIRKARGLTQEHLAEMIGKHASTIQRAEVMHPSAKLETYLACADALKISVADLFVDDLSAADATRR